MPIGSERAAELPGPLYCDASALAKLFLTEAGSGELNARLAGRDDVVLSDLAITEVTSALARRVREGSCERGVARQAHRKILATLAGGAFRRIDLLPETHREAERLLLASQGFSLRAADALHLALALGARAAAVLTYDRALARGAIVQGIAVWPESIS